MSDEDNHGNDDMLFRSEDNEAKDSDGGQSKSIGWYLKYRKSKLITSKQDTYDSEFQASNRQYNFSRSEQNQLLSRE